MSALPVPGPPFTDVGDLDAFVRNYAAQIVKDQAGRVTFTEALSAVANRIERMAEDEGARAAAEANTPLFAEQVTR